MKPPKRSSITILVLLALISFDAQAESVVVFAAGSLKLAFADIVNRYRQAVGEEVMIEFGPSGIMRERIEAGAKAHVFASANMEHPQALAARHAAGPVVLFARNTLCALAQPELAVVGSNVLSVMLDSNVLLGTSTPKADPSGDYAWKLFEKADKLQPGAFERLSRKALQLTGAVDSETPPPGRNRYAWVMENKKADVFLTYCTNAVAAKQEVANLQIVSMPPELSVGADYGLTVLDGAPLAAWKLAFYLLSPPVQEHLSLYGFEPAGLVQNR